MSARMDAFFAAMGPFLAGQSQATDVERALGASASGTSRLQLYQTLVSRQSRDVLGSLFPAVRRAMVAYRPGLWETTIAGYTRAHPPTHWEPNRFGASFSDYLIAERELHPDLPSSFEELADFAYTRFAASVSNEPADGVGMDSRIHLRGYDHDVAAYTRAPAAKAGEVTKDAGPERKTVTFLIAWSGTLHRVIEITPSLATLAAIGRRLGDDRAMDRADAPTEAAVMEADYELVARGVLRPS